MRLRALRDNVHTRFARSLRLVLFACAAPQVLHASDWLQFGGDAAHGGFNAEEAGYSTATGNRLAFPAIALPATVDSAPLYVSAVATESGVRDLLIVQTRLGMLIALSAADGSVLWSRQPAGMGSSTTSTPAVDPERQHVYACGVDGKIHKYQIADGSEVMTGGWPQAATLKPAVDKIASGLTIATVASGATYLYVVTNSFVDTGDYQGHVVAVDLASGAHRVFNAQCSRLTRLFVENGTTGGADPDDCASIASPKPGETANSGIWGRPGAVYSSATDRVYVATGNGSFDPVNAQGHGNNWGDSVLALNPDATGTGSDGQPLDSYTPANHVKLLASDADLGSTSPAIVPAPPGSSVAHLALQGGKDGCFRLLNLDLLSGQSGSGHVGGELSTFALPGTTNHCSDGGITGFNTQPAIWTDPDDHTAWAIIAHGKGIAGYDFSADAQGNPAQALRWSTTSAGTSPVIANGIVYYATSSRVRALNAKTGALIWSDDRIGNIHWQSPIVVNGRLYIADQSARLWVYELDGISRGGFE